MKIWHISDTHGIHHKLDVPPGIDLVVHTGDASNRMDPQGNAIEMKEFMNWYSHLPIPNKIFIPGNHDTSIESGLITKSMMATNGIQMLINEEVMLNGLKIWGSPYVPRWGAWAFMEDRGDLQAKAWNLMPEGIDILLTHTPAYGYLDLTYHAGVPGWENVGCKELSKAITDREPKLHCFGHIHSFTDRLGNVVDNNGCRCAPNWPPLMSHACTNLHGSFGKVWHNGSIIDWQTVETHWKEYERHKNNTFSRP